MPILLHEIFMNHYRLVIQLPFHRCTAGRRSSGSGCVSDPAVPVQILPRTKLSSRGTDGAHPLLYSDSSFQGPATCAGQSALYRPSFHLLRVAVGGPAVAAAHLSHHYMHSSGETPSPGQPCSLGDALGVHQEHPCKLF
ncbi:hypothetical protein GWK47_014803 [Chionoecetes opilio]|uniref:Uncharacterized protein n=1 Tax=Chionoecetes opilio TaxID=41210 RepID=A0A8J5CN86_CHIOP|nr:hypothetical protein GWK47_014803 [Chionoecetes opilio]